MLTSARIFFFSEEKKSITEITINIDVKIPVGGENNRDNTENDFSLQMSCWGLTVPILIKNVGQIIK